MFKLMYFGAEWCPSCKRLKPFVEKMVNEYSHTYDMELVDADENPEILREHAVQSLPTVIIWKGQNEHRLINPSPVEVKRMLES